jgi:hypothetical protein
MAPETVCPSCGRTLRIPESALGQSVECPACAAVFTAAPPPPTGITEKPAERRPVPDQRVDLPDDDEAAELPPPELRPKYALHPPSHVVLAAAAGLLSPLLAGCILLAINYVALRRYLAAVLAVLVGLAGEAVLTVMLWNDADLTRQAVLFFMSLPLMFLVAVALQGRDYRDHTDQGGPRGSPLTALGIGVAVLMLSVAISIALTAWLAPSGPAS